MYCGWPGGELQQMKRFETLVALATDNHVIMQRDADRLGGPLHLLCHVDIGIAWRRITARVVVDHDDGGGV